MANEQIMLLVREKIASLQRAMKDNIDARHALAAEAEECARRMANLQVFIDQQEAELVQLKQWLLSHGAEDVNV